MQPSSIRSLLLIGGIACECLLAEPATKPGGTHWGSVAEMNEFYTAAFVANDNFGVRRMRRSDRRWLLSFSGSDYSVGWPELVSLLKHDRPQVYVMDFNPMTDRISEAETRELTDWETQSLDRLRNGEDTHIADDAGVIRAIGALRATKSCLECHQDVEEGALLGAFTYQLESVDPPATQPAVGSR